MLTRGRARGEPAKTVAPATIGEFLGSLLPAVEAAGPAPAGSSAHATGPSGPLSRVWGGRMGSDWIFCAPPGCEGSDVAPVEPAQVPVDRLASVLASDPPGPLFGLIGHPVQHSASPAIHHGWMRREGAAGAYILLDVETERELRDLWPLLGPGGFRGLNVTHPWKALARALADTVEPMAEAADAASCLTFEAGRWTAALTDAPAIARRLRELNAEGRWDGREFALIGAGGAARAALVAARTLGASVSVFARRPGAVSELERRFPGTGRRPGRRRESLVVHATTVGRSSTGALEAGTVEGLKGASYCLDLVYRPVRPVIRELVESAGGTYEDGERVLRYQAEESYTRWYGRAPPEAPGGPG